MKLIAINTGDFKLDGGAMFGVVPKVIWNKIYPADENNHCTWAMRCLLVIENNRKILIDCGIGDKQDERFFRNYYLENMVHASDAVANAGVMPDEITDVVLTHLHFDHCGGALKMKADRQGYEPTFKNAVYWSSRQQWEWAINPNRRESASFLKENFVPLYENGKLKLIESDSDICSFIRVKLHYGHTAGQLIPFIKAGDRTLIYLGDLIPSSAHIPLPYIMSYDTSPLISLKEKESILEEAANNNYILFFEHDHYVECCSVIKGEKGCRADRTFKLSEIF